MVWGLETSPVLTTEGPAKPGKEETQGTGSICPTPYPSSSGRETGLIGQTSLWAQTMLNGRENLIAMSGALSETGIGTQWTSASVYFPGSEPLT